MSKKKKPDQKQKSSTHPGNIFDRIFKENAEHAFLTLIEQKLEIKIKNIEHLPEKIQQTVEREMDRFYRVTSDEGEVFILHVEFQTTDDLEMIYRMARYHGLILAKYTLPIKSVVIYLGKGKPRMRTQLHEEEVMRGFDLINIYELDTERLLSSQVPEIILLAIMTEYPPEQVEAILRLIRKRLMKVCKSQNELLKYLSQLLILSRLRKLEAITYKIIKEMPILFDIEQDTFYQEGMEKGMEEGMEKGMEKGTKQERSLQEQKQFAEKVKSAKKLIKLNLLTDKQIADALGEKADFVRKVKAGTYD